MELSSEKGRNAVAFYDPALEVTSYQCHCQSKHKPFNFKEGWREGGERRSPLNNKRSQVSVAKLLNSHILLKINFVSSHMKYTLFCPHANKFHANRATSSSLLPTSLKAKLGPGAGGPLGPSFVTFFI